MSAMVLALGLLNSGSACRPPSPDSALDEASLNKSPKPIDSIPISVEAYSGHDISRYGPVRVIFAQNVVPKAKVGQQLAISPFIFEPNLSGRTIWTSRRELQYQLDKPLDVQTKVSATLRLDKISAISDHSTLHFEFWPTKLLYDVNWVGWTGKSGQSTYNGVINTTDRVESKFVEKMLSVDSPSSIQPPKIRWSHAKDGRRHRWRISDLKRSQEALSYKFKITGEPIGVDFNSSKTISIPAENALVALNSKLGADNSILVRFSDPIDPNQNFSKYIRVKAHSKARFSSSGNTLRIFSENPWVSPVAIQIKPGLKKHQSNQTTRSAQKFEVIVRAKNPEAKFLSKGVIIPSKNQPILPIKTLNLHHIWVAATRVPNPNLNQFLQVNDIDGNSEMVRVGRVIWKKRIDLDMKVTERNRWVRRGLDLKELTAKKQSGLYRLHLYFGPHDTYNSCPQNTLLDFDTNQHFNLLEHAQEASYWDNIETTNSEYDYYQRFNPCNLAFYRKHNDHNLQVSKNVFISDIGIVAKKGNTSDIFVAVSSLNSTSPLENAEVTVFSYTNEPLAHGRTDMNGFVHLKLSRDDVFSVIVKYEDQLGILKLTDGRSLSVAHFDASGVAVEKGIKGYIFGERDVWRPGDKIHLSFVLFDTQQQLPKDHPVELTVRNPRGQLIHRSVVQTSPPIYRFDIDTTQDAPTGKYMAEIRIGPVRFKKALAIETVIPNRLKIGLDFGTDLFQGPKSELNAKLEARWLHGATASNLDTTVDIVFAPISTRFPGFADFIFDDPTRKYQSRPETLYEGTLDEKGQLKIQADIKTNNPAPGMLRASFITRVFEESGQASIDRHSVKFSPYERYIGIKTPKGDAARGMLLTDKTHHVNIAAVDPQGQPSDTTVKAQLYKIQWRWWWEKGSENLADYASDQNHNLVSSAEIKLKNGKGKFPFEIKYPQWGRYLLLVSDNNGQHRSGKILYIDWPGWAGRQQKDDGGAAHRLVVASDKKQVNVGETFKLSFPSPKKGRALLSIENSAKVINASWIDLKKGATQVEVTATPEMVPNIYAHITILQPYQDKTNDRPMRLYGLTPIIVTNPNTQLSPELTAPLVVEPESAFDIKVAEQHGSSMSYTLSIVDEGLLGLTRYKTPNPWDHFFRREALSVKTWDVYDHVAGGYAGVLETILAIGGGANADENEAAKGLRFKPIVQVLGPFNLDANQTRTHSIKLPPYLGEVRAMVVAASQTSFGAAEASIRVSQPLMVLSTSPRVLSPNETFQLPVTVFSSDKSIREVQIKLDVNGPVKLTKEAIQTLNFSGSGEKTIQFPIKVGADYTSTDGNQKTLIPATFALSATSGQSHRVGERTAVPLRHPTPQKTKTLTKIVTSGSTWTSNPTPVGVSGTNSYILEISRVPPLQLEQHLGQLLRYPHGCLEQTVSKVFPQLFLPKLVDLSLEQDQLVRSHVSAAIRKLRNFQQSSGEFSYWPGVNNQHAWSNIWAGHFLIEARQAGYAIDPEILTSWLQREAAIAEEWTIDDGSMLTQAYRLYTLALAGQPSIASMNRLRGGNELSSSVKLRLSAAYALAGEHAAAETLASKPVLDDETNDYETFGTPLRDLAMTLESYVILGKKESALVLAKRLSEALTKEQLTTHETSYGLLALAKLGTSQLTPPLSSPSETKITWQGQTQTISLTKPIAQVPLPSPSQELLSLSVNNTSSIPLYVSLVQKGHPPAEATSQSSNGLKIKVEYYRNNKGISLEEIQQGDDIVVNIDVSNVLQQSISDIAVSHLIPTGMVLRHDRLNGRQLESSPYDYQDVRDDRVYTYLDLQPGMTKRITVRLHAQFRGHFFMPPIRAEAMYDAQVYAETSSEWFQIATSDE